MVQLEIQFANKFQKFQAQALLLRIAGCLMNDFQAAGELSQSVCNMFLRDYSVLFPRRIIFFSSLALFSPGAL